MLLGKCHLCGCVLVIHSHFVADGYQHEEYYCNGCGEFSRGVFPLRLNDAAWRELYERRQKLIEGGPDRHHFADRARHKGRVVKKWAAEVYDLTQQLVRTGEESPTSTAKPSGIHRPSLP